MPHEDLKIAQRAELEKDVQNEAETQLTEAEIRCFFCKEEIRGDAIKCKHCGQYQKTWKRYVDSPSIVLSLLVALLSVAGVVAPILKRTLVKEKAELKLAVVKGDCQEIDILISNLGKRSAVITDVAIDHKTSSGLKSWILYPKILGRVVEPNKSYKVESYVRGNVLIPRAIEPIIAEHVSRKFDVCSLSITVIQHDGTQEIQKFPFSCSIPK